MRYNVLLWDLDGTLTDPKEGIIRSVQYALERLDYPLREADGLDWIIKRRKAGEYGRGNRINASSEANL